MALRDLPWVTILFSGVVAALAYGTMRLIQVRRFYKDLVRGQYPLRTAIEATLTIHVAQAASQFFLWSSQTARRDFQVTAKRRSLPGSGRYNCQEIQHAWSLLS
jgi:hypothetical protein